MAKKSSYEELKEKVKRLEKEAAEREVVLETLVESDKKWHSLLQDAPSIVTIVDRKGRVQYINRAFSCIGVEDAIGSSHYDFAPPKYHKAMKEAIKYVFETAKPTNYEIEAVCPDRSTSWYLTHVGPVKRDGKVVGAIIMPTDITEQKRGSQEDTYREDLDTLQTRAN